jgi:uncharacterized membrane protein YebE (DUF533 family)
MLASERDSSDAIAEAQSLNPLPGGPKEHDESVIEVLAAKILVDWLRNRQQLLAPFTIELRKLGAEEVDILLHAMVAAAQADGDVDGKESARLDAALAFLKADDRQRDMIASALTTPKRLSEVLAQVRDVKTAAIVYAASLLAIDRRKPVNRHYLRYLAARLQLPQELARSLEQRFRAPV